MTQFKTKFGPGGAVYYLLQSGWVQEIDRNLYYSYTHPTKSGRKVIVRTANGFEIKNASTDKA